MQEIREREAFDRWLDAGVAREPAAVRALDLCDLGAEHFEGSLDGSLFLGCSFSGPEVEARVVALRGVVLGSLPGCLFRTHRASLYSAAELFEGLEPGPGGYDRTLDARIYAQYLADGGTNPNSIRVSLARRLHDHSITDALHTAIDGRRVVAIMGGHSMVRAAPIYAGVARIARRLTRDGYLMVSGGGPGAMEATHLGAYFAPRPDAGMVEALAMLAPRPPGAAGGEYADPDWLERAWRVRERFPTPPGGVEEAASIGIPTWFYGHEPPAAFASSIAKYFANSVREDGLLSIARHGVIFAPGSAGTIQEIFQDAAQNHYASMGSSSPMVLLGTAYWTRTLPAWPLLEALSAGRRWGELVALTDDEDRAIELIEAYDPARYARDA